MIISQAHKAPAGAHREPRAKHLAEWKQTVSHGGSWPYIRGVRQGSGKSVCPSCLNRVAYIQQVSYFCGLCQDFSSKKYFFFKMWKNKEWDSSLKYLTIAWKHGKMQSEIKAKGCSSSPLLSLLLGDWGDSSKARGIPVLIHSYKVSHLERHKTFALRRLL